jgi:hypothetical protein
MDLGDKVKVYRDMGTPLRNRLEKPYRGTVLVSLKWSLLESTNSIHRGILVKLGRSATWI